MKKLGTKQKWKIQRQLGVELPGLGRPGALEKRAYPPGQHGKNSRRKVSSYGAQLREKQKLLFHYGLREEQLRRFVRTAKKQAEFNWIARLITLLESRIDNIVFRLGIARSIPAARQLVSHGHVFVNGRRLTIPSAVIRRDDRVSLSLRARDLPTVQSSLASPRLPLPSYLTAAEPGTVEIGVLTALPGVEHVPFEFNPALVAEYYAIRGVK